MCLSVDASLVWINRVKFDFSSVCGENSYQQGKAAAACCSKAATSGTRLICRWAGRNMLEMGFSGLGDVRSSCFGV